jgi:hypothetical protein
LLRVISVSQVIPTSTSFQTQFFQQASPLSKSPKSQVSTFKDSISPHLTYFLT